MCFIELPKPNEAREQRPEALAHYREALRIHERALGADSPAVADDRKRIHDAERR